MSIPGGLDCTVFYLSPPNSGLQQLSAWYAPFPSRTYLLGVYTYIYISLDLCSFPAKRPSSTKSRALYPEVLLLPAVPCAIVRLRGSWDINLPLLPLRHPPRKHPVPLKSCAVTSSCSAADTILGLVLYAEHTAGHAKIQAGSRTEPGSNLVQLLTYHKSCRGGESFKGLLKTKIT